MLRAKLEGPMTPLRKQIHHERAGSLRNIRAAHPAALYQIT